MLRQAAARFCPPSADEGRAVAQAGPARSSIGRPLEARSLLLAQYLAVVALENGLETSGVLHLRFHDLRGTAATNFIRAGLDLDDVAMILGWAKGKVEQIAARYVTGEAIGLALVEKLRRNRANTKAVNDAVKPGG